MTWKKIDDAQAVPDFTYSAFLGNGLMKNMNDYPLLLPQGGCFAFREDDKVTWAAFGTPLGQAFTVNVGVNARSISFTIRYQTETNSVDAQGYCGWIEIRHLNTNYFLWNRIAPAAAGPVEVTATMPFESELSGTQTFWIGFVSAIVGEGLGFVDIQGGSQNQVFLDTHAGGGTYTISAGRKFEMLDMTGYNQLGAGNAGALRKYQIARIDNPGGFGYDGVATIVPDLDNSPPIMNPFYDAHKAGGGNVYELGAFTPLSINYFVGDAYPNGAYPQLAHSATAPLTSFQQTMSNAIFDCRADVARTYPDNGRLGKVLEAGEVYSAIFTVEADVDAVLNVSFRGARVPKAPFVPLDLSASLYEDTTPISTYSRDNIPMLYLPGQGRMYDGSFVATSGILTDAKEWGLADAMPFDQVAGLFNITFSFPRHTFRLLTSTQIYRLRLTMTCPVYITDFYAQLTRP
jgi:hypothetical protein